jgi:hypothetical protein
MYKWEALAEVGAVEMQEMQVVIQQVVQEQRQIQALLIALQ